MAGAVSAYPSRNFSARVSRELGRFWFWTGAGHTAFRLDAPALLTLEVGAGAALGRGFELTASGSRQKTSAVPVQHYLSAGLSWRLPK